MSIPGSANALLLASTAAAAGGYQVSRSLRFNSSDSGFCSRTPAVAGNRRTWTWAGWVKRSGLSSFQCLFSAGGDDNFGFSDADKFQFYFGGVYRLSTQVFRDTSAWYHLVAVYDSPNATAQNRIRVYVNGSEITAWDTNLTVTQNRDGTVNNTVLHAISFNTSGAGQYLPGYLADIHFIDGQALTPSSFTEVSATTGQLVPIAYTGTFGTNGFWLKFSDNSAATAAALGNDYSGNNNDWTPNNLSVTAGAGNDSLVDTPTSISATDTGVGGEIRGNYATLNPLLIISTTTLSNGNLESIDTGSDAISLSTIGVSSGKWYWEITGLDITGTTSNQRSVIGIVKNPQLFALSTYVGSNANGFGYYSGNGQKITSGTSSSYGATWATSNVMGVALDLDNGTLVFYKNNTSQGTAFTGLNTGDTYFPAASTAGSGKVAFNFGQRAFAYTAPSGFKALCDTNLGAPVVAKPNTVFDVALWTGNATARSIPLNFSPDFVWGKDRTGAGNHNIYDIVRGANIELRSNETMSDRTNTQGLTSFDSNGFSLGTGSDSDLNLNGRATVAWCWDAGTSTVSNTQGSITSQVRANVSAGFSVVTVNSTTIGTIGHGLGIKPAMIIEKCRGATSNWYVRHQSLGDMKSSYLALNTTAAGAGDTTAWNNTEPTSTTISINNNYLYANGSVVYYCFTPVVGYSSFGSYTGNGSTDGTFVYTGFRPRFIFYKPSNIANTDWVMWDTARNPYNICSNYLLANTSGAEGSAGVIDLLSNGFKLRVTSTGNNGSGDVIIYAAFAENPFQYARAR